MANPFYLWQRLLSRGKVEKNEKKIEKENKENKEFSKEALQLLEILRKENWEIENFLLRSYKNLPVSSESKKSFTIILLVIAFLVQLLLQILPLQ